MGPRRSGEGGEEEIVVEWCWGREGKEDWERELWGLGEELGEDLWVLDEVGFEGLGVEGFEFGLGLWGSEGGQEVLFCGLEEGLGWGRGCGEG